MAFTVPGARPVRVLYNTAKRIRDELGKGQEVLRSAELTLFVAQNATVIAPVHIPDVDIIITGVKTSGRSFDDADAFDLYALADGEDYETAPGATNKLITSVVLAATLGEDTVVEQALLGLNGNRVRAGQPIVAKVVEDNSAAAVVYVKVSYILADEERTY